MVRRATWVLPAALGLSLQVAVADPDAGSRPLWGYADLHLHPASHLAFGATDAGGGPMWGSPGGRFEDSDPKVDLPPCEPTSHDPGFSLRIVNQQSRQAVTQMEDAQTNLPHERGGWPDFAGWPDSQSISHQQMHVSWLHRAWEGGLRVIIADTVDTELIAMAWNQDLFRTNAEGKFSWAERVKPIPGFDFESAKWQINFIKDFAKKNSQWMQVVTDSHEAEAAIAANKLAVILGVEMDALTVEEIKQLYKLGVRHVVPIHLANSTVFGGSALYSDVFNSNSKFQAGAYVTTLDGGDQRVPFRLSEQTQYAAPVFNTGETDGGWKCPLVDLAYPMIWPHPVYCGLNYTPCAPDDGGTVDQGPGQKNAEGLLGDGGPILSLMKLGMLIDVAHMGDESTQRVLEFAAAVDGGYPILDTHTDLADPAGGWRNSERDLKREFAKKILTGGGMIGLGTGPHTNPQLVGQWAGAPLVELSPTHPEFLEAVKAAGHGFKATRVKVRVWTGLHSLSATRNLALLVYVAGEDQPRRIRLHHRDWLAGNRSVVWHLSPDFLPAISRIQGFGLRLEESGRPWDVEGLTVGVMDSDGREHPLLSRFGTPLIALTSDEREWATTFLPALAPEPSTTVKRVWVRATTGADSLDGNADDRSDNAVVRVEYKQPGWRKMKTPPRHRRSRHRRRDPSRPEFGSVRGDEPELPLEVREASLNEGRRLRSGAPGDSAETFVELPNVPLADIESVSLVTWFRGGCFHEGNWAVNKVEVQAIGDHSTTLLASHSGSPWTELTTGNGTATAYQAVTPLNSDLPADHVMATITTGPDHALSTAETVEAVVLLRSQPSPLYLPLYDGSFSWGTGETRSVMLRLPDGTKVGDIEGFGLRWIPTQEELWSGENHVWDVQEISLEVLSDPVQSWLTAYQDALSIIGGHIAMGTDLNGLAPQIQYSTEKVDYPFRPACDLGAACPPRPFLGPAKTGNRTFDPSENGISHVGMVPDFLEAATKLQGGAAAIDQMYRTADEVVRMWRRVEEAQKSIP